MIWISLRLFSWNFVLWSSVLFISQYRTRSMHWSLGRILSIIFLVSFSSSTHLLFHPSVVSVGPSFNTIWIFLLFLSTICINYCYLVLLCSCIGFWTVFLCLFYLFLKFFIIILILYSAILSIFVIICFGKMLYQNIFSYLR